LWPLSFLTLGGCCSVASVGIPHSTKSASMVAINQPPDPDKDLCLQAFTLLVIYVHCTLYTVYSCQFALVLVCSLPHSDLLFLVRLNAIIITKEENRSVSNISLLICKTLCLRGNELKLYALPVISDCTSPIWHNNILGIIDSICNHIK